jgi:predicted Zn-dependent peptidase
MAERKHPDYYIADILSDSLSREKSSLLYLKLKKEKPFVSEIVAYITGSIDEGLFIISGKLNDGISFEYFDNALWEVLNEVCLNPIEEKELNSLKIKMQTARAFQEQGILNRSMNLCYFELLGDANGINEEHLIYELISCDHIQSYANELFQKTNCSLLKIKAQEA